MYAKQIKETCAFTRSEIQPEGLNMAHYPLYALFRWNISQNQF